jgi:hypothetical protein
MIYKNKTHSVPSIEELISLLKAHDIDMILTGSEAGSVYNLCESVKDIDFMLNSEESNQKRMFLMLKKFFNFSNFDEFKKIDTIRMLTLDKKQIEFFTDKDREIVGITQSFQYFKSRSQKIKVYNSIIDVVHIEDYINIIQVYKIYLESYNPSKNTEKIEKYNNNIKFYEENKHLYNIF